MNFRKTSKRPLTPPHPIFGKKCCAFVREIGARSAFPLPKKRNIIFRIGNDPPPIRKFSENSSNLVQVVTPKSPRFLTGSALKDWISGNVLPFRDQNGWRSVGFWRVLFWSTCRESPYKRKQTRKRTLTKKDTSPKNLVKARQRTKSL